MTGKEFKAAAALVEDDDQVVILSNNDKGELCASSVNEIEVLTYEDTQESEASVINYLNGPSVIIWRGGEA